MIKAPLRILIVAALCVLSLVALVVREAMARASGAEIVMAMQPVDPRALLSGHYVIVSLQQVIDKRACENFSAADTRSSWVALSASASEVGAPPPSGASNLYAPTAQGASREEVAALGEHIVRGWAACADTFTNGEPDGGAIVQTQLTGVERFYINQTEAERIDRMMRGATASEETRVFAILSIGRDGRARVKGLIVDGERLELGWR